MNKRRHFLIVLFSVLVLCLCGCRDRITPLPTQPNTPPVVQVSAGESFVTSGFKIRSEIKAKNSVSGDSIIFEVYVDGEGDGAGLIGYQDNVYDVYLVRDHVYVAISKDIIVHVSDLSAHMIPSEIDIYNISSLESLGFSLLDGHAVSYTGGTDTFDMVSKYEASASTFEPVAISSVNNMSVVGLLKYFFEASSTPYTEAPEPTPEELEMQSYYVNSEYGLEIHGVKYSIGDYCAPYTYFEGMVPQGMNEQVEYKQDEAVTFVYTTYISSDGSSMFMTTDGYVQAMQTSSDFVFLGRIKRGMSEESIEALLGLDLDEEDVASFKPIVKGLRAYEYNNNYRLLLGDLIIDLVMSTRSNRLVSIIVTNYLDFRG